jgi:hypothetical protein
LKIAGGIISLLGILYLLNSSVTYFALGKIKEHDGWANFTAIAAFGVIVTGVGLALFVRKPK